MLYFVTSPVYVRVIYCKASCYLGFQLHRDGALVRWVRHFDKVDACVTLQQVLCHAAIFTLIHTNTTFNFFKTTVRLSGCHSVMPIHNRVIL
jgi:hypothetical protein